MKNCEYVFTSVIDNEVTTQRCFNEATYRTFVNRYCVTSALCGEHTDELHEKLDTDNVEYEYHRL